MPLPCLSVAISLLRATGLSSRGALADPHARRRAGSPCTRRTCASGRSSRGSRRSLSTPDHVPRRGAAEARVTLPISDGLRTTRARLNRSQITEKYYVDVHGVPGREDRSERYAFGYRHSTSARRSSSRNATRQARQPGPVCDVTSRDSATTGQLIVAGRPRTSVARPRNHSARGAAKRSADAPCRAFIPTLVISDLSPDRACYRGF